MHAIVPTLTIAKLAYVWGWGFSFRPFGSLHASAGGGAARRLQHDVNAALPGLRRRTGGGPTAGGARMHACMHQ